MRDHSLPKYRADQLLARIRADVTARGYSYIRDELAEASRPALALLFNELGRLRSESTIDGPFIATSPSTVASEAVPFDRAEALGWHGDFTSFLSRPQLSIVFIERADPRQPQFGDWRVASSDLVIERLLATADGRAAVEFLQHHRVPYNVSGVGTPSMFHCIERRGDWPGRLGFRFYARGMRNGARTVFGRVPSDLDNGIREVERAADEVAEILPAITGATLVTDNWHCLHDRLEQTVDGDEPLRRALLCFVDVRIPDTER